MPFRPISYPVFFTELGCRLPAFQQPLSPYLDNFFPALASILIPFPGTELYDMYKDEYDLQEWWLREDRSFGVPQRGRHAYFEEQYFRLGAVLDADFFRYSPRVRNSMYETFRFMHRHNNSGKGFFGRLIGNGLVDLSRALWSISPRLERTTMGMLRSLQL